METISTSLLSTQDLCVGYAHYGKENILFEKLNISLTPGKLICFMGPNGIGKSSLIRTLAGLQKPLSGKVIIHGATKSEDRSRDISVVLTDRVSAVNMTVYEVVAFGRYPYLDWSIRLNEKDHQIIDEALSMVHIKHLSEKKLYELSDGQLQMTMIARALAQDTPIILLDEPTAHLDLNNRVEIMKLLKKLSLQTNKAILVSTHELDLALQMADLIWLSGRDKNILTGFPEDLVLDGSFDAIFEFKGFDLKSGKIQHEAFRGVRIHLVGNGAEYLWTKNALERSGFEVTDQPDKIQVSVIIENQNIKWVLNKSMTVTSVFSLEDLIKSL